MSNDIKDIILNLKEIRDGVPQFLYIGPIEPEGVIKVRLSIMLQKIKNGSCDEIDFIINSPGGSPDDAYRIIRMLRDNYKTVNVIVPFWAKSAATLLSLGASTIVMDQFGEFGPLDMQIGKERDDSPEFERESALNDEHSVLRIETRFKEMFEAMYLRIYEHRKINISKHEVSNQLLENLAKFYEPLLKQINPYKLGEKRRKLDIGAQYARRILLQFNDMSVQDSRNFVDFLINECPDHGYVIDYAIVRQFLSFVKKPDEFMNNDYAETLKRLSLFILSSEINGQITPTIEFIENEDEDEDSDDNTLGDTGEEGKDATKKAVKKATKKAAKTKSPAKRNSQSKENTNFAPNGTQKRQQPRTGSKTNGQPKRKLDKELNLN